MILDMRNVDMTKNKVDRSKEMESILIDEALQMANFAVGREINPRKRIKVAKYWLGYMMRKFPEHQWQVNNILHISEVEK